MRLEKKMSHHYKLICEGTEETPVLKILNLTLLVSSYLILKHLREMNKEVNFHNIDIFLFYVSDNIYFLN
jgi:hypothetical protein